MEEVLTLISQKRSIAKWGTIKNRYGVKVSLCLRDVDKLLEKQKSAHLYRTTKNYSRLGELLVEQRKFKIIVPSCMDFELEGKIPFATQEGLNLAKNLKEVFESHGWSCNIQVDVSMVEAYLRPKPIVAIKSCFKLKSHLCNQEKVSATLTFLGALSFIKAALKMNIPILRLVSLPIEERNRLQWLQIQYLYPREIIIYPRRARNIRFLGKISKNPIIG